VLEASTEDAFLAQRKSLYETRHIVPQCCVVLSCVVSAPLGNLVLVLTPTCGASYPPILPHALNIDFIAASSQKLGMQDRDIRVNARIAEL
jgi:hypothetical protein